MRGEKRNYASCFFMEKGLTVAWVCSRGGLSSAQSLRCVRLLGNRNSKRVMSSRVVAVELRGLDEVELTWEAGVMQKVALRFLSTGRTGDVYEALDAPYVLKIMRPELRAGSRNKKTASIPICSPKVFPSVYGVVSSGWHGRIVQITVAERVTHTMRSWFRAVLARNHEPDEVAVQLVKHVMRIFFSTSHAYGQGLALALLRSHLGPSGRSRDGGDRSGTGGTQKEGDTFYMSVMLFSLGEVILRVRVLGQSLVFCLEFVFLPSHR